MKFDRLKNELERACEKIDGEVYEDKTELVGKDRSGAVFGTDQVDRVTCFVEDRGKIEAVGEKNGQLVETRIETRHSKTTFEEPLQVMDSGKNRMLLGNIKSGNTVELTRETKKPASRNAIKERRQRVGRQAYHESKR